LDDAAVDQVDLYTGYFDVWTKGTGLVELKAEMRSSILQVKLDIYGRIDQLDPMTFFFHVKSYNLAVGLVELGGWGKHG
jgi:hypothetical protein